MKKRTLVLLGLLVVVAGVAIARGKGAKLIVKSAHTTFAVPTHTTTLTLMNTGDYDVWFACNVSTQAFEVLMDTTNAIPLPATNSITLTAEIEGTLVMRTLAAVTTTVWMATY